MSARYFAGISFFRSGREMMLSKGVRTSAAIADASIPCQKKSGLLKYPLAPLLEMGRVVAL